MKVTAESAFDAIAPLYQRHWESWYLPAALPALDRLFFSQIPAKASVLDVCCGCGHVTAELLRRGYRVTGVDNSSGLLQIAAQHYPDAEWLLQDVRELRFNARFQAALSTFDSLNHLLTWNDLLQAFRGIYGSLEPGALFVFDMNVELAFEADLSSWAVDNSDDHVSLIRGHYNRETRLARTQVIWFQRNGATWNRHETIVQERCYSEEEIAEALGQSGFTDIRSVMAEDAGMVSDIGYGRIFFSARK